jgi:hypothetical protein
MVLISATVKYKEIAFITHAFEHHFPSTFSATLSFPESKAMTASWTAWRYSSFSSNTLSSNAASICSLIC